MPEAPALLNRVEITRNSAEGGEGSCYGYQYCYGGGGYGGGIYAESSFQIDRAWFVKNSVQSGPAGHDGCAASCGGGIFVLGQFSSEIVNTLFVHNAFQNEDEEICKTEPGGILTLSSTTLCGTGNTRALSGRNYHARNSIIWFYSEISEPGGLEVVYSNLQGGWPGEGNINQDPLFVSEFDPHLGSDSPCIDAGISDQSPAEDIDGEPRPNGTGFDMGADEYWVGYHTPTPTVTPVWTATPAPTPTPTPALQYRLIMQDTDLATNDIFNLELCRFNWMDPFVAHELLWLNIHDEYWFWPGWTQQIDGDFFKTIPYKHSHDFILNFEWPETGHSMSGLYFGAILIDAQTLITRAMAAVEWQYR